MARYIDAEELKKVLGISETDNDLFMAMFLVDIRRAIDAMPDVNKIENKEDKNDKR